MSLPVPSGSRPLTDEDLALLATSPGWAQSPSGWFDRSGNDEDTQAIHPTFGSPADRHIDHQMMMDDIDDGLPLSMELRGSDAENMETIHPHYWDQVFTSDERLRKMAMARISRGLKSSLNSGVLVLEQSLPRLARLLSECPYKDVHDEIEATLHSMSKEMSEAGISGPVVPRVSRMFKESVLPITTALEPQATLFKASFLNTGRVTHLFRIMAWHPSFLERHTETYDFLLRAEGPLPFSWRHYLAILSASRFQCDYIVRQQEHEFLLTGGDESWLESPKNCPPKLLALLDVNALLAHQPWRLQPSHIALLTKSPDPSARWSTGELVHAFLILATFRALSGLAIGMGINQEVDLLQETHKSASSNRAGQNTLSSHFHHTSRSDNIDEITPDHEVQYDSEHNTDTHDSLGENQDSDLNDSSGLNSASPSGRSGQKTEQLTSRLATRAARSSEEGDEPKDAEQRKQLFEQAGDSVVLGPYYPPTSSSPTNAKAGLGGGGVKPSQGTSGSSISGSSASVSALEGGKGKNDRFWRYNEPHEVSHTDFDVRSKEYSVFHIQDWSWEEHAFELIERAYHKDFAQLLDLEFTTIFELTYHNVNGQAGIDTAPFRRSIWYYVHRIHGILHDDYNYATVNELLLRNLKKFTKDLSCTPFAVTPQDLLNLGYSLTPEEKCHIALLATEARKQAELMYALHALSKHLSSSS